MHTYLARSHISRLCSQLVALLHLARSIHLANALTMLPYPTLSFIPTVSSFGGCTRTRVATRSNSHSWFQPPFVWWAGRSTAYTKSHSRPLLQPRKGGPHRVILHESPTYHLARLVDALTESLSTPVVQPCMNALPGSRVVQHCTNALLGSPVVQLCTNALLGSPAVQPCTNALSISPIMQAHPHDLLFHKTAEGLLALRTSHLNVCSKCDDPPPKLILLFV